MKILSLSTMICLLLLGVACNAPVQEEQTATKEASEMAKKEMEKPKAAVTLAKGGNYTTKLLQDGIPSPRKEMTATMGDLGVTINYGSPSVKGRTIWGGLEKYGKVWRSGANAATTIEFSKDVMVEGKALKAGKYVFLTIPTEEEWSVIFTEEGQSAFNHDESKEILRVAVDAKPLTENVEQLQYVIEDGEVALQWEKLSIPFKVEG